MAASARQVEVHQESRERRGLERRGQGREEARGTDKALEVRARQEPGEPHGQTAGAAVRDTGRGRAYEPGTHSEGATSGDSPHERRRNGCDVPRQVDITRAEMPHSAVRRTPTENQTTPRTHPQRHSPWREQRQNRGAEQQDKTAHPNSLWI